MSRAFRRASCSVCKLPLQFPGAADDLLSGARGKEGLCNLNETNTGAQGEESLGLFVVIDGSVSVHRSPPQHMQRQNLHSDADMPPSVTPAPRDHPVHEQGFVQCVVVVAAFGLCIIAALTQVLSQRVARLGRIIWRQ
jgi:hypothetical protein